MLSSKEYTGKTVDDAIQKGLVELGVTRDDVEIRIVDMGQGGVLGIFGRKPAKVEVKLRKAEQSVAQSVVEDILKIFGVNAGVTTTESDEELHIEIGEEGGILIGRRGQTLNSLQYLVNRIVNEDRKEWKKIVIDIDGYRNKREETLKSLAVRMAKKALVENRPIEIGPMNAMDRRLIHMTLQNNKSIETYSRGIGLNRRVYVAPKGMKGRPSKFNNGGGSDRRPPRRGRRPPRPEN